ncbi:hypothetical protein ACF05W_33685 [Streptomyces lydicus]|uniref:hypothetical protein n=1 Tax=Streptomyces lydicus TaxID=47763 RepID=UPI0036F63249
MAVLSGLHVSPEFPAMLERIDALGGALEADADAAEELGRLTEDVARALFGAGVVAAALPQSLGGYEFSPRQLIETVERVSYHDSAAGWTMMALQLMTGTTAAYVDALRRPTCSRMSRVGTTRCWPGTAPGPAGPSRWRVAIW